MKIYLDYNATTPVDREVINAMQPYLDRYFGNPSSAHSFGSDAKSAVENARRQVAELINCRPHEIIFTSGGTESNNFAIKGYVYANEHRGRHIITSVIEHPAVTEVCRYLEGKGLKVTWLPVDGSGIVNPDDVENAITGGTILISIMHANNEIGTIQPIGEIAGIARRHNIAFHTDAAQSVGKYPVDVRKMGVDLLSIAGHKLYAPKGVGALYIKDGIILEKLIHGADHEQNKRAGTENVAEIAGLGKACEIAHHGHDKNIRHMQRMRDMLQETLIQNIPGTRINGHPQLRLPNTLSISFQGIEANILLDEMESKGIAASAGGACHTGSVDISPVLTAIGLDPDFAMGTIRFSVGRYTTEDEINRATGIITDIVNRLRPSGNEPVQKVNTGAGKIQLTKFTQGLGCACKLRPQELEKILKEMPLVTDPNVLIDAGNSDDAAVYRINNETAIVQTVDFFTPVVDEPYNFGSIAAANALSDIYAMGAKPLFALNIVGFPSNRLPMDVLKEILKGASDKAAEAGISVLGGHTIDDPEPKYGMVVCGMVNPDRIWANSGARENDVIILTKPLGTGILTTALKRGLLGDRIKKELIEVMSELNKKAADIIKKYSVHGCTDITGFGLIGHLSELSVASSVNVELFAGRVPLFEETINFAAAGIVPGGTKNNLGHFSRHVVWDKSISSVIRIILCDAQTSGGLLFTVPGNEKETLIGELINAGLSYTSHIGNCLEKGEGMILVKNS